MKKTTVYQALHLRCFEKEVLYLKQCFKLRGFSSEQLDAVLSYTFM